METLMNEFSVKLFSLKADFCFLINGVDIDDVCSKFLSCFHYEVDHDALKLKINPLQRNTTILKKNIVDFVECFKNVAPSVNRLPGFFEKLDDNEFFFIFAGIKELSVSEIISASNYLMSCNDEKVDFTEMQSQYSDIFKTVWENYDIITHQTDRKVKIGESLKSKRICRFCNKSKEQGAKFSQEAHAISEALGNKTLIINEECDDCNNYFSKSIEKDLITYQRILTTFFGIKNKNNKVSKIKGKNFEYVNIGDNKMVLKHIIEQDSRKGSPPKNIPLKFYDKITVQNIYKALSKFALSVLKKEDLVHFDKTKVWIRTNKYYDKLPKVAVLGSYHFFNKHPQLIVYFRKSNNKNLPYAVGEFHFTYLTYVFIIPTFRDSDNDFLDETEYKTFWECFNHYKSSNGWTFEDYSNFDNREFVFNMNLITKEE